MDYNVFLTLQQTAVGRASAQEHVQTTPFISKFVEHFALLLEQEQETNSWSLGQDTE